MWSKEIAWCWGRFKGRWHVRVSDMEREYVGRHGKRHALWWCRMSICFPVTLLAARRPVRRLWFRFGRGKRWWRCWTLIATGLRLLTRRTRIIWSGLLRRWLACFEKCCCRLWGVYTEKCGKILHLSVVPASKSRVLALFPFWHVVCFSLK